MKATTKLQIAITDLAKKLSPISNTHITWAKKNCLNHEVIISKKGVATCLDCGYSFQDLSTSKSKSCICPTCNTKLNKITTLKRKFHDWAYFSIIDRIEDFQIVRNFRITAHYFKGKEAIINCMEVCQFWIHKSGKFEIFGKMHTHNYYLDTWSGDMEIRNKKSMYKYDILPFKIYPKMKILKEIKRTGFEGQFHGLTPSKYFYHILDNRCETLLKANQIPLFLSDDKNLIKTYWSSIKICIRNSYPIKNPNIWFDYLQLLKFFNKDLRNHKFVCPDNLYREHDKYVKRKREYDKRQQYNELLRRIDEEQKLYKQSKAKFFGLSFGNSTITISVLEHVQEFHEISNDQNICLFTNEYFKKEDSLVLIAKSDDQILETIELSLSDLSIRQCTGHSNKETKEHNKILSLVQKNIHQVEKRLLAG